MSDTSDRGRDLAEYANASGQSMQPVRGEARDPGGHALVRPTNALVSDRPIGAQPVAIYRDEARILQKLGQLAAAAGTDWFYRFPVRKKDGGVEYIEGPSIKLANDVARIFGNDVIEIREIDVGDAWVFYSRFTDIETGFSMERAYRQRKSQGSMKTRDAERQLDIAYQIGQSKAIRNVICNSLQIYADYAFEQARNSLVEKIGKDLPHWRERTLQGLRNMPEPVELNRVERVIGRASKDWLAPHVAQVIAMMKSVADGMASVEEVFPPIEAASSPAAGSGTGDTSAAAGAAVGPAEGGGPQGATTGASKPPDEHGPAGPADPALTTAYQRGKEAAAKGFQRKAIPIEFRDTARQREAVCWQAGFDGAAMPSFTDETNK